MTGRLDGKVAIISGGARGQGAAEARLFAAEGARVVVGDVLDDEGAAVAEEIGDAALYVHLDVTDEAQWAAAVKAAEEAFGPVSVLINNAGILLFQSLHKTTLEDFERVMRVNVTGVFLGMKAVTTSMVEAGGGSIVNVSSTAGLQGLPYLGAYVASKWAVRGLSKTAAIDLGQKGIRVNSVHPGGIDTPMVAGPRATRRSTSGCRCPGWARPTRWRPRCCSWPPTRPATSRAPSWRSTAAPPAAT
jgi:3alpha(or 20beta)-hydroxysteroid dehydrogenase